MEQIDYPRLTQTNLPDTAEALIDCNLIYRKGKEPVWRPTPVGLLRDAHVQAVFDQNFADGILPDRTKAYIDESMPEPVRELVATELNGVNHRRGFHNATSYDNRNIAKELLALPAIRLLGEAAFRGSAQPAGSLLYAEAVDMESIELAKISMNGGAWQLARMAVAESFARFSGKRGEWLSDGGIDKGPEFGRAAYDEDGTMLAFTARARKQRGPTDGDWWHLREFQSHIARTDEASGVSESVTKAFRTFANKEMSAEHLYAYVRELVIAADGNVAAKPLLVSAARIALGRGDPRSVVSLVESARTVRDFFDTVTAEIERDTLEVRPWAVPVTLTIYTHNRSKTKNSEKPTADIELRTRLLDMVRDEDERQAVHRRVYWQQHVERLHAVTAS